jgi:histidinol phosphatase-like enzyme (inositol monophosphatase family)
MQEFITLAHHLADEAGKIIKQYYRQPFDVESKQDESPVTIADKSVEQRLRAIVEAKRPEDGIIGEEYGIKDAKNQYTWVFDPIDGTKSFVIGRPTFGTLIALCENGVPILGVIDQPILKERWIGVKGEKTLFNGKPVSTRPCAELKEARLASTGPYMYPDHWQKIYNAGEFMVWGGDCYSFGLMANGNIDVIVEGKLSLYDFAALVPVVEGAGGHMCDWSGNALNQDSDGMVLAVGDIALKDQLLEILK